MAGKKSTAAIYAAIISAVVGAVTIIAIPLVILRGWVLEKLWGWFATPLGLPDLGVAHAIGIAVLVSFLTHQYIGVKDERDSKTKIAAGLGAIVSPFATLLVAYIIHSFM